MALVRAFQAEALARTDLLAANLGVLSGDLMGFAHQLAVAVQANLAQGATSAAGRKRLFQDTEVYLKIVRQIDRLAQLERRPSSPKTGEEED
jgi:hypothetical protein